MDDLIHQFDSIDGLDSRLHKSGSLGVESELVNELLEVLDLSLLALSLSLLLLDLFSFGLFKLIEVTFVVVELLALELDDLVYDLVEEVSGMRNDDDSDVEVLDVVLEPDESDEI